MLKTKAETKLARVRVLIAVFRVTGDYEEAVKVRDAIIEELVQVQRVLKHTCAFDDNDYCSVCGADGRA